MKIIKLLLTLILVAPGLYAKSSPTFELWNKLKEPIYFSYGSSAENAMKKSIQELRPGHYKIEHFSITSPTTLILRIGFRPKNGDEVDVYTFRPNKKIYVRVGLPKEDKIKETIKEALGKKSFEREGYIFGPQIGPLLGIKGVTEHDYSLEDNVTLDDIFQSTAFYKH